MNPAYRTPSVTVWPWKPTKLVGLPPDVVKAKVLGELHSLRLLFSPGQGVKL